MLIFQPPKIDECSMVTVKHYDVRISSNDSEMILERTEPDHVTTFIFDYVDDRSVITFKINITVIDINGQRSNSSVVERSISDMPNIRSSKFIATHNHNSIMHASALHGPLHIYVAVNIAMTHM